MPQSINIDLPLVIVPHGELTLVRPIGFPEIAIAAGNPDNAHRLVRRYVIDTCKGSDGGELVELLVRGPARQERVTVEIAPPKRSDAWREPIDVDFDTFVWEQDASLIVTYVPSLALTIVSTPKTDVESLVQEQIRSALRRQGSWELMGLAALGKSQTASLEQHRFKVDLLTPSEKKRKANEKPKSKTPTLGTVATRLRRDTLRPAYHRDDEVQQLASLLSSSRARSVLLVGPSGVGKTAVFHQWVRQRDEFGMQAIQCWATDGSRLISGQSGFGMWQQQCLKMAEEASRFPSVVHLGNLVELSESGRLRGSGGCGSLLAPRLASGSLRAVIECTPEQLSRMQRVEPRLLAALTTMRIEEPAPDQTRSILLDSAAAWRPVNITAEIAKKRKKRKRVKPRVQDSRLPEVEPSALQVLDRLHRRFRTDAASPGRPLSFFHATMSELKPGDTLDVARVIESFGRQTGLPPFLIDDSVRPDLNEIEEKLASQVLGQPSVIKTLVDMIATLAADLSRGDRPLASLLLIGPTGVGKTETAKALARLIYSDVSRLVRIDMSEMSTPAAVGRLIGDAMHPEGILTSAVRAQPFSLVLLDEFEKAHPSVFDLLLQVLGEGRLTDGHGRVADFRNSIVLMTSNLGVESYREVPLGLADTQSVQRYRGHFEKKVREFLRPEMFNRIDRILTYDPLSPAIVQQIAKLRLDELQRRSGWKERGRGLSVSEDAVRQLSSDGYQAKYGARPLAREIEKTVLVPLAEAICNKRSDRLEASVQLSESSEQNEQVNVSIESIRGHNDNCASENVWSMLTDVLTLRRRSQSLARCSAVRKLRNECTLISRKIKRMRRKVRDEKRRDKVAHGPLAVQLEQKRNRLRDIARLTERINAIESDFMVKYYLDEEIDLEETKKRTEDLQERMWRLLCELNSEKPMGRQQISLVLSGPNFHVAQRLLTGYTYVASRREWKLQVHALLRREKESKADPKVYCDGWTEDASFRIATQRDNLEVLKEENKTSDTKPSLAAYLMTHPTTLPLIPENTLALMMTFRGEGAELSMSTEEGVHTFRKSSITDQIGESILVSKHTGAPIDYVAPNWLPTRDYQMPAAPRRYYDLDTGLVSEFTLSSTHTIKSDREGRWLDAAIEEETKRRVWAALDETEGDGDETFDLTDAESL